MSAKDSSDFTSCGSSLTSSIVSVSKDSDLISSAGTSTIGVSSGLISS